MHALPLERWLVGLEFFCTAIFGLAKSMGCGSDLMRSTPIDFAVAGASFLANAPSGEQRGEIGWMVRWWWWWWWGGRREREREGGCSHCRPQSTAPSGTNAFIPLHNKHTSTFGSFHAFKHLVSNVPISFTILHGCHAFSGLDCAGGDETGK